MAYCRFGKDSDVYLYKADGGWECCRCQICKSTGTVFVKLNTIEETIAHLKQHIEFGHNVPQEAFHELEEEKQLIKPK